MISRRVWPALVLALFCLPLFLGLRNQDLVGDEAAHSFSVDRILETGTWLIPKQSPFPNVDFVEKPPLKFWLVAAGIKAGLPHDEFGLRFWDALFAAAAFLYLYGIGRRLAGPWCGVVAPMILFVHGPLMFIHGVRGNNMEAGLLLCYCGGFYHYFGWSTARSRTGRLLHAAAVAVYFSLGFMVKFVAALFLPMVLGLSSVLIPSYRRRVLEDWRIWLGACFVAFALSAPWYIYATVKFGRLFWNIIFGTHVYTRLTTFLDPDHVHPWNHYFTEMSKALSASNTLWLVVVGAVVLVADTIRRRSAQGFVVILWFAIPLTIISFGSSKLYHYAYPFLPPIGLAAGYFIATIAALLTASVDRALHAVGRLTEQRTSRVIAVLNAPAVRTAFLVGAVAAAAVVILTILRGTVVLHLTDRLVFRNRMLLRPALVSGVLFILGGWPEGISRFGIPLFLLAILPTPAYRGTLSDIEKGSPVVHNTRDCVARVGARPEMMTSGPRGIYVDGDGPDFYQPFNHQYTYYFRSVTPWRRPADSPPEMLHRYLFDPAVERPVLISLDAYRTFRQNFPDVLHLSKGPQLAVFEPDVLLLLPGPYAACAPVLKGGFEDIR